MISTRQIWSKEREQRWAKHRAVQGVWKLRHWYFAVMVVCFMSCCITYVGVCHAQRWTCRVNLPVQLLSKLMCFYNHGISPLGSWMIVWFQYLLKFAIKATCIRHVSDCFLWSKKVRFGFMLSLSLSLCNGVGKHLNKIHKILWFLLFVSQRYACKKTMYHLHHSYHWFNLPNGNLFQ